MVDSAKPRYQHILDQLSGQILSGHYKPGQKLPSEAALVQRFGVSRITVGRAVRELQQLGLVERVAGSGTYVRRTGNRTALLFGLIIPDLGETEIFEPICQGIASSPDAKEHALLWAHTDAGTSSRGEQALELCRHCIERQVSGVFFAPVEMIPSADEINRRVLRMLKDATIPVVLLDRRAEDPSAAERCDLVGIDNHRAGYLATEHLLRLGATRIAFVSVENQASTVIGRLSGFRDALRDYGQAPAAEFVFPEASPEKLTYNWGPGECDAFVCANDRIAGALMRALLAQHVRIPADVRIVGIDDVAYAALLPVPLTTVHQPCRSIGEVALRVMLERLNHPRLPARNVLLDCNLVIRESCGTKFTSP